MAETFSFMRGNVLVMTVCRTLWRVSTGIVWPFLSLYVLALGGRYETIGMVIAVGNLAGMILYPLGGYIYDYNQSLPWYILSAALVVLGLLFIALVEEPKKAEV